MRQKNAIVQNEKYVLAQSNRQDSFTEDQFRHFGTTYATGLIDNTIKVAQQYFTDSSVPYDKAMYGANQALDSVLRDFTSDPRVARIIDKPSVQATVKFMTNQVDAIKSNLKTFESKTDAATYMKNATSMMRDADAQRVMKVVSPGMVDVLSKLQTVAGVADMISSHPEISWVWG